MREFMPLTLCSDVERAESNPELIEYTEWEPNMDAEDGYDYVFCVNNWLYITMVILPQYIGDWHFDANWMVTHMTAKKFKHPIDYLYEKYG